ncbi:MAG: hypothetical protein K2M10_06055 [Muribaculaceae bacterium]|nr:hypothetical protein [Muribaculaceae bacterium]
MNRNNRRSGFPKIATCLLGGAVLAVGMAIVLNSCGGDQFSRTYLDKYVETVDMEVAKSKALKPGTAVYVDFSDGMNHAYTTETSQNALRSVVNAFTGVSGETKFYSLADSKITPLNETQTGIYNAIMSGANYTKTMAPIEETLKTIVNNRQAALLITDFEEYNNGVIQRQNYAKDYFISWLSEGYNIIFYKIDYSEKGAQKHLYFTVFDSPESNLSAEVEKALGSYVGKGVDKFVLAGTCFNFAGATSYLSSTQGGNYHNGDGEDIVTAVMEGGTDEAFKNYTLSAFSPFAEYYPFGVDWKNINENIKATQEEGMPEGDKFTHLLSKFYVDFDMQNGYTINGVAADVVNFEPAIQQIITATDYVGVFNNPANLPEAKPVLDMFTVSMAPAKLDKLPGHNWTEIFVDLDQRFQGELPSGMNTVNDLLKIDVVIADATPRLDGIESFFAWPGNTSLSESVKNTILSDKVNPKGRAIITYFVKVM